MTANIKFAFYSIWNNKVRSTLTLLGVVIGVASVTTLISLGEGLKKDVSELILGLGTNVIAIVGGKIDLDSPGSGMASSNPADLISGDILTTKDIAAIQNIPGIEFVAPISLVPGIITVDEREIAPMIIGTYPNFIHAVQILSINSGEMFTSQMAENVAVIGNVTTEVLFDKETDPVGKTFMINTIEFKIVGVLGKAKLSDLMGSDFDNLVLIPFDKATEFNQGKEKILRIIAKATDDADIKTVSQEIKNQLIENHDGLEDFSVITQNDLLALFNDFLNLATAMVSAIAAISLVVGGIGIMNIMLVTVTERTSEIGLRKAVGATKLAILIQFLVESMVITFIGGLIGLGIAVGVGFYVEYKTSLAPVISWQVITIAISLSTAVGVIFGLWPAMHAASKDPIEALRHE